MDEFGGPGRGLILLSPPGPDIEVFAISLAATLDRSSGQADRPAVAAVLLRLPELEPAAKRAAAAALVPICHAHERPLILSAWDAADLAIAGEIELDGVHLERGADGESGVGGGSDGDGAPRYAQARAQLGETAIIGVDCGLSRDLAMAVGSAGADYVAFAPDEEILAAWSRFTIVPCVALAETGAGEDRVAALFAAGADFVTVTGAGAAA